LDGVGIKGNANMTAIHGKASSAMYGRRYLLCLIFNIPTGDDVDGNANIELIEDADLHKMRDALIANELKEAPLCKYLKIDKIEDMRRADVNKAFKAIEEQVKAKARNS